MDKIIVKIEKSGNRYNAFDKDGNKIPDKTVLYKPGDVYIVGEDGWLRKTDEVNALLIKHESNKIKKE